MLRLAALVLLIGSSALCVVLHSNRELFSRGNRLKPRIGDTTTSEPIRPYPDLFTASTQSAEEPQTGGRSINTFTTWMNNGYPQ